MAVAATMLDAHEQRIRTLEGSHADISVDVARLTADVEHLHAAVTEQVVPPLQEIAREVTKLAKTMEDGHRDVTGRLTALETAKKAEIAKRALWVSRITGPAVLIAGGVAGALATKFGEAVWLWLQKL